MQRRGPRRARSGCERAMARLSQKGGKRRVAWSLSLFPSPSPGLSPLPRALLTPPCALYTMRENQRSAQRRQQHGRPSATVGHCRCVACAVERRKRVAFFFFLLQPPPFFFFSPRLPWRLCWLPLPLSAYRRSSPGRALVSPLAFGRRAQGRISLPPGAVCFSLTSSPFSPRLCSTSARRRTRAVRQHDARVLQGGCRRLYRV